LVRPANPHLARLRFPFPGSGVRAFDGEGRELTQDSWLSIHRLAGVRLVAVGIDSRLELRLALRYPKEPLHQGPSSCHVIRRPKGDSRVEIHLQDFSDALERLFSAADLLDAWVETSVIGDYRPLFILRLSRYLCPLERVPPNVALTREGLERIAAHGLETVPVLALRLESPGDEPVALEACRSEGVCTGAWTFLTADREPGSWLIYPGAEAEERFRPTLWVVTGECVVGNRLTQALAVKDREERTAALDKVIAAMSADYVNPCWPDLERLAGHLGHLPLASFDLWRRFAHSPAGMAALILRLNYLPEGFVRRFALELPFAWELVPYRKWAEAAEQLHAQCCAWFGASNAQQEMEKAMDAGLEKIREECPVLSILFGILRSTALGVICKEVAMMRSPAGERHFHDRLFGREDSSLQRLLRDHADDNWPTDNDLFLLVEFGRKDGSPGAELFDAQHKGFRDGIINLPILLAIQVATDSTGEWFTHPERIHKLRSYRDFDPDWFDEAFDLTIARCLSLGLLNP